MYMGMCMRSTSIWEVLQAILETTGNIDMKSP